MWHWQLKSKSHRLISFYDFMSGAENSLSGRNRTPISFSHLQCIERQLSPWICSTGLLSIFYQTRRMQLKGRHIKQADQIIKRVVRGKSSYCVEPAMILNEEGETDRGGWGCHQRLFSSLFSMQGPQLAGCATESLPTCLLQISQTIYPRICTLANSFNWKNKCICFVLLKTSWKPVWPSAHQAFSITVADTNTGTATHIQPVWSQLQVPAGPPQSLQSSPPAGQPQLGSLSVSLLPSVRLFLCY